MLQRNKSISAWQSGIMLFVLAFANKVLILPSLIGKKSRIEAMIVLSCLFLFDMILLFLFFLTKRKHPNKSLFELIKSALGNGFLVFFSILCCIFFFSKAVFLFNVFQNFMRSVMYKNAVTLVFLICLLPVAGYFVLSGIRTMCRTMQMFFPILAIVSLFCVVVGFFQLQDQTIMSSFSFLDFSFDTFKHIGAFGDSLILFLFMDKISVSKGEWKVVFSLSILGDVFVFLICAIYLFSYPYTYFLHPFAVFELLSFVKEYNGLGRIDIIVVILMMIFFIFQFSIYMLGFVFSFKNICPFFSENYIVGLFDFVFAIVIYFFVTNIQTTIFFGENIMSFSTAIPLILLPVLIFYAKKGDK